MKKPRESPYNAFNFLVSFGPGADLGGFSDVSGLTAEIAISEYRDGSGTQKPVSKIPRLPKAANITLKRGIIDAWQFSAWLQETKLRGVQARRALTIILRDETGSPIQRWKVQAAVPQKWTGPALAAKNNDVAMEELVLTHEGLETE